MLTVLLALAAVTAVTLLLIAVLVVRRVRMTWPLSIAIAVPLFVGLFGIACIGLAHVFVQSLGD